MTARDAVDTLESVDLAFASLGERLVYIYLRYHADKRGVIRLAMSELAALLGVNRQTVLKHVEALAEKRLVRRQGHGRYLVYAQPWTPDSLFADFIDSLSPGTTFEMDAPAQAIYGLEAADLSDERHAGLIHALQRMERSAVLTLDEESMTWRKAGPIRMEAHRAPPARQTRSR